MYMYMCVCVCVCVSVCVCVCVNMIIFKKPLCNLLCNVLPLYYTAFISSSLWYCLMYRFSIMVVPVSLN